MNVLEAVRRSAPDVGVVINVTSDKCYENREDGRPFSEDDPKGGRDPYSSSKACAELVTDAYRHSFFAPGAHAPRLASARAGNVIGGGDWGAGRLIPDLIRGALAGEPVRIRNPASVRPWQHVLNPLSGYLELARAPWADPGAAGGWNFAPDADDALTVRHIVDRVTKLWPQELPWSIDAGPHPPEAVTLLLTSTKAREQLGWFPGWRLEEGLEATVSWYSAFADGCDMSDVTGGQIADFTKVCL